MGSKRRIAKEILPLMLAEREIGQFWVEPFVGGGNMIDKVTGNRIGSDVNPYTIQALISIRDNVDQLPKNNQEFTESDYKALRKSDDYKFKGYAGFACSFGARWLGGWCRDGKNRDYVKESYDNAGDSKNRDYVKESYDNAVKQSPYLQGIELYTCSYDELFIPKNSIIYCDPPYANTSKYKDSIDHDKFWNWCRQKAKQGHKVFISEYNAPDDFKCIWEKEIFMTLDVNNDNQTRIEKLFTII
jgi:DNA adenine methylase